MKVRVDIVTGFLGAGKTAFINGMLQSNACAGERVAVVQCEAGEEEIDDAAGQGNIFVKKFTGEKPLEPKHLQAILTRYHPHRIIIEHNGTRSMEELFEILDHRSVRKACAVNRVVHVADAGTFEVFMKNMGGMLAAQISESDLVVVNNHSRLAQEKIRNIKRTLKALNKSADILTVTAKQDFALAFRHGDIDIDKKSYFSKPSDKLFMAFALLVCAYFAFSAVKGMDPSNIDLSWLQVLNTIFMSILIQAFPFILFGVFVSSVLQVFVPAETIVKLFPKNKIASFIVSILAGLLFPVCDCAIVPVAGRLVKKGVPLFSAVTFMLSAPLVNPVVIASTLYAFPGQPSIAFYRVYLGVTIAFAVGMFLLFFPEEKPVVFDGIDNFSCKCGYCGEDRRKSGRVLDKISAIFKHAGAEFFEVGRFLIIGAFLSSMMQTVIPKDLLAELGGGNAAALAVMMLAAFILSVCSTSDAFIARSFTSQFPMGAVMGFMVLGPMIDVKNLLMLLGSFRKSFVIKLVCIILTLSFALLYFFSAILF